MFRTTILSIFLSCTVLQQAQAQEQEVEPVAPYLEWEILNRFSPFETLADPEATFQMWKIENARGFEAWRKRLRNTLLQRMPSPYSNAVMGRWQLSITEDIPAWNIFAERHEPSALRFIHASPETPESIKVQFRLPNQEGNCLWKVGADQLGPVPCNQYQQASIQFPGDTQIELTTVAPDGTDTTYAYTLKPEHLSIVAFGDSYGSGEGNPDVPTGWASDSKTVPRVNSFSYYLEPYSQGGMLSDAYWMSERCHRSFFSYQSLSALILASQDPHRIVSFLHYACTGAGILDGVLTPQNRPGRTVDENRLSQINYAIRDLCGALQDRARASVPSQPLADLLTTSVDLDAFPIIGRGDSYDVENASALLPCEIGDLRTTDLVFLSVGGNDIGFGDIIRFGLAAQDIDRLPASNQSEYTNLAFPDVCPSTDHLVDHGYFMGSRMGKHCDKRIESLGYHAGQLVGELLPRLVESETPLQRDEPQAIDVDPTGMISRYGVVFEVLTNLFDLNSKNIIMSQYPDPLRMQTARTDRFGNTPRFDADYCEPVEVSTRVVPQIDRSQNRLGPWDGLYYLEERLVEFALDWSLTRQEMMIALAQFDDLRQALVQAANRYGITLACAGRDAFVGNGWWQGRILSLMNMKGAEFHGEAFTTWRANYFDSTWRAVRTVNDSLMTQLTKQPTTRNSEKDRYFYGWQKEDHHGTFHPNLLGHIRLTQSLLSRLEGLY